MVNKVKIGIYDYVVDEVDYPLVLNGRECSAVIDYNELLILINANMPNSKKQQSLWHEIMHGIIREYGISINGENEEDKVDWLATGICQVLNDNPELYKK